jgi:threonylcarbamoyladenosine tRNA methylthiotransferase MtaB
MDRKIKNAAVLTLGCKTNAFESIAIKEQLENKGVEVVPFSKAADLYIINTCSVTSKTDVESRRMIRRAKRTNPGGIIAVTGCYAQLKADELKNMQGVDYIFGNTTKRNLVEHILASDDKHENTAKVITGDILKEEEFHNLAPQRFKGRNRAFLKIQDGCDSFCSYCIVPYARGTNRSLGVKEVLGSINRFVKVGFKEVVLSGIHIGTYGSDLTPKTDLVGLMKKIEKSTKLKRLRLSSIEPNEITDVFIELARSSKILCSHLHVPLQSGDDEILKKMNRQYTAEEFSVKLNELKNKIPDITIGADVIAGFPGETDEHFENTYSFIENSRIDYLHVFPYSKREGTPAYDMPGHVDEPAKKERARLLRELGERKRLAMYKNSIGKDLRILFEKSPKEKDGFLHGITTNYLNAVIKDFAEDMFNNESELRVYDVRIVDGKPVIYL